MERGIRGGGICINKLPEGGLLNFFKKMRGDCNKI